MQSNDTTVARPRLYVSDYTKQVMRAPHIEKRWLSDLYIAPLDHKVLNQAGNSITLARGQSTTYQGWDLTFARYDVSQHGDVDAMRVGAVIDAHKNGENHQIIPAMESGPQGRRSEPVRLGQTDLEFSLVGMSVEQKSVTVKVDGPMAGASAGDESLVLSVSRKPLTSLVWAGFILITLGTAISFWRRSVEQQLLQAMAKQAPPVTALPKNDLLVLTHPTRLSSR